MHLFIVKIYVQCIQNKDFIKLNYIHAPRPVTTNFIFPRLTRAHIHTINGMNHSSSTAPLDFPGIQTSWKDLKVVGSQRCSLFKLSHLRCPDFLSGSCLKCSGLVRV